tara:strand:+ start:3914 stop:4084 length:171 start_codon:yes stop_codon:yes gene_type:complete
LDTFGLDYAVDDISKEEMNTFKGYVHITSELRTKNGSLSLERISFANARGPAVPRG